MLFVPWTLGPQHRRWPGERGVRGAVMVVSLRVSISVPSWELTKSIHTCLSFLVSLNLRTYAQRSIFVREKLQAFQIGSALAPKLWHILCYQTWVIIIFYKTSISQSEISNVKYHYYPINLCSVIKLMFSNNLNVLNSNSVGLMCSNLPYFRLTWRYWAHGDIWIM